MGGGGQQYIVDYMLYLCVFCSLGGICDDPFKVFTVLSVAWPHTRCVCVGLDTAEPELNVHCRLLCVPPPGLLSH